MKLIAAPPVKKLFVTFAPDDMRADRVTLQLQTLASIYGMTLELPYRVNRNSASLPHRVTIERINRSDIVVVLSGPIANRAVQREVKIAVDAGKVVAVFHVPGKAPPKYKGAHLVPVNYENPPEALAALQAMLPRSKATVKSVTKKETVDNGAVVALLGIGLGLWLLSQKGQ